MSRIIGDRRENTLDEMLKNTKQFNADVAEEERQKRIEEEKRKKEEAARKAREAKMEREEAIKAKAEAKEAEEARKRIGKGIIQNTPTPEVPGDVTRDGPALGLLYSHSAGDYSTLHYHNLGDSKDYILSTAKAWIQAIFATDDNVYYGNCEHIRDARGDYHFADSLCSLFTGNCFMKKDKVNAIEMVNGMLVDSGHYGLDDTLAGDNYLEKTPIISMAEHDGSLYGMLTNSNHKLFARIKNGKQPYMCEPITIFYSHTTSRLSQMIILPYSGQIGKVQSSPLTVAGCAYGRCLDINGFAIAGTEDAREIKRIALLSLDGNIADIAYCCTGGSKGGGEEINAIKVDISTLKASGKRTLAERAGTYDAVYSVRSPKLHEKLLRYAQVKPMDDLLLYDNVNGEDTL